MEGAAALPLQPRPEPGAQAQPLRRPGLPGAGAQRPADVVGGQVALGHVVELVEAEAEVQVEIHLKQVVQQRGAQRDHPPYQQSAGHEEQREDTPQDEAVVGHHRPRIGGRVARIPDHQNLGDFMVLAVAQRRPGNEPVQREEGPDREHLLQRLSTEHAVVAAVVGRVLKEPRRIGAGILQQRVGAGGHVAGRAIDGEEDLGLAHHQARIGLQGCDVAFGEARRPKVIGARPHEIGGVGLEQNEAEIHLRAEILGLADVAHARVAGGVALADGRRAVGRAIVGDHDVEIGEALRQQAVERRGDAGRPVIDGHAHGQLLHAWSALIV